MSDSEEFLSAEEDYDEDEVETNINIDTVKVSSNKYKEENDQRKEENLDKLTVEINQNLNEEKKSKKEGYVKKNLINVNIDTPNEAFTNKNMKEPQKKEEADNDLSKLKTDTVTELCQESSNIYDDKHEMDNKTPTSVLINKTVEPLVKVEKENCDILSKLNIKEGIIKHSEKEYDNKTESIEGFEAEKDDNWDFDDWGAEDKDKTPKKGYQTNFSHDNKMLTEKNNKLEVHKENKEDNWNFADWGENSNIEKEESAWDDFGEDEWIDTTEIKKNIENSKEETIKQNDEKKINENPAQNNKKQIPESVPGLFESSSQINAAWNGWKPWGGVVTSLLSTATEGVTSLTTHVSQVIENSIGIPEPEELVKINQKLEEKDSISNQQKVTENNTEEKRGERQSTLIGIVSGVTTIGNKVITGGLDTLEGIGKKTMNILQENDPLLLNKRRIIGLESSKPNLSQVLREAKEKSEEIEKNLKYVQKQSYKRQLHFETLFDHYYGLVHLEALEMLSKQCDIKIQSLMTPLSGKALEELKETLNEVKELCELDEKDTDDHDEPYTPESLEHELKTAIQDFGIPTDFSEIIECWKKNIIFLEQNTEDVHDVFEKGLRCLAETCALQMNKMHKIAELLIIKEAHSTVNEADSLVQITNIFSHHLKDIANKFGGKLNGFDQTEEVKTYITNIFLEVYNSTSYVQDSFKLFIPILQVGAA